MDQRNPPSRGLPRPHGRGQFHSPSNWHDPTSDEVPVLSLSPSAPEPRPPRRRWIGAALLLGIAAVAVFSIVGGDRQPPAPTPTTVPTEAPGLAAPPANSVTGTTLPVSTLSDHVPGLEADRISIAFVEPDGRLTNAIWGIASVRPLPVTEHQLSVRMVTGDAAHVQASFSSNGRAFAYSDGTGGLIVQSQTVAAGVRGWKWHTNDESPTWVAAVPGTYEHALYAMDEPSEGWLSIREVRRFQEMPLSVDWYPTGYGPWGFALTAQIWVQGGNAAVTVLLDQNGDLIEVLMATVRGVYSSGSLLIQATENPTMTAERANELAETLNPGTAVTEFPLGWWVRDAEGIITPVAITDNETTVPPALSSSGDVITFLHIGGQWRITTHPVASADIFSSIHMVADVDHSYTPLGVSSDGRWAVFGGAGLAFHDLELDVTHIVPFDLGQVVAVGF